MTLSDRERKVGILQVQFAHIVAPVQKVLYPVYIFHLEVLMFCVKVKAGICLLGGSSLNSENLL